MRYADLSTDRYDIHNASPAPVSHMRDCGQDRVQRPPGVSLHRRFVILERHGFEGTHLNHSGIIDQHINRAVGADGFANSSLHFALVPDIAGNGKNAMPDFIKLLAREFERSVSATNAEQ